MKLIFGWKYGPMQTGHLLLTLGLLAAAGCAAERPGDTDAEVVRDDLGREVAIPQPVERIAALAPNLTEIIFALGAENRLVGVSTADDYPPEVAEWPRFDALLMDAEHMLRLQPQLLLANDQVNSLRKADQMEALGIPTYFFQFSDIESVVQAIRTTGRLLNIEPRAEELADSLSRVFRAVEGKPTAAERPRVLLLIDDRQLYAFGGESYVNELIEIAGGHSVTARLAGASASLSDEFVLAEAPDIIIGAFGEEYDARALLERRPTWRHVPAVQNNRVHSMDDDLLWRPGPRLAQAARELSAIIRGPIAETP